METTGNYLFRTHYSRHFTAWVKYIVMSLVIVMLVLAWIFSDDEYDSWWVLFPVFILIGLAILLSPVDDLAIDSRNFYHLKTSLVSFLNKSDAFEMAQMKSIQSFADNTSVSDSGKYTTVIEMTFNDGSAKSFKVTMLKTDVDEFEGRVRSMIKT